MPKLRLAEFGRELGLASTYAPTRDAQIDAFQPPLPDHMDRLGRDEQRAVSLVLSLDDHARDRGQFAAHSLGTTPKALASPQPPTRWV